LRHPQLQQQHQGDAADEECGIDHVRQDFHDAPIQHARIPGHPVCAQQESADAQHRKADMRVLE